MKKLYTLLIATAVLVSFSPARADCMRDINGRVVCDQGKCARDLYGKIFCSASEDGAAVTDGYGGVVCGKGSCVTTIDGDIICSARPGGAAMKDLYGKVTCDGGCQPASRELCGQNSETEQ
jgi:hypothetical protein